MTNMTSLLMKIMDPDLLEQAYELANERLIGTPASRMDYVKLVNDCILEVAKEEDIAEAKRILGNS